MTNELVCRPDYWLEKVAKVQYERNIEVIQKLIWDDMGLIVSEFSRSMFTVRSEGDPTSWSPGEFDPDLNLFGLKVKYPKGFVSAKAHCGNMSLKGARESLRRYEWKVVKQALF